MQDKSMGLLGLIGLSPIGKVVSSRTSPLDDQWGAESSHIVLGETMSAESLKSLESFSHVEVIFFMHQVDEAKVQYGARTPRNNPNWPRVGILAQRGKNRPNKIGTTICKIKSIEGIRLYLERLDAIDGTPVLDIKPWINEFGPNGPIKQPLWASELMENYW